MGANGFISRKNIDLFAEFIVSLLPVMIVCRLAESKSCMEGSGVDIVLIRQCWGRGEQLGDGETHDIVEMRGWELRRREWSWKRRSGWMGWRFEPRDVHG